MSLSYCYTV